MRRMIDPQTIIKSQIVDDKYLVDLNELLEKYGSKAEFADKTVTLQFYSKEVEEDNSMLINTDTGAKGFIMINTAITISKLNGDVFIRGLLVDWLTSNDMNFLPYIKINDGDYENGIQLSDANDFDVYVIKV